MRKGDVLELDAEQYDLSKLTIGLGWRLAPPEGVWERITTRFREFDLDAILFLLDPRGRVPSLGEDNLEGSDVIYFNNLRHPSGHVEHGGNEVLTGGETEDHEHINVNLDELSPDYQKIMILAAIYQAGQRNQHFGEVTSASMRISDGQGKEIAHYELEQDGSHNNMRSVMFGEICREDDGWQLRAVGDGYPSDSFATILGEFVD